MPENNFDFEGVIGRLKAALAIPTDTALAERLGMARTAFAERRRRQSIPADQVLKLCEAEGLRLEWVLHGHGPQRVPGHKALDEAMSQLATASNAVAALSLEPEQATQLQELLFFVASGNRDKVLPMVKKLEVALVPKYSVSASAGNGAVVNVSDTAVVDYMAFQPHWLREIGCSPNQVAVISVRGDSMADTLNEGDLILVDTRPPEQKTPGIYVLHKDGTLLVKRLNFRLNGNVEIKSDNRAYPTETVSRDEFDRLHIVGRVVRRVVR